MITRTSKPRSRLGRAVVVLVTVTGLLAGCSGGTVSKKPTTATQAQATARADQILRDTAAALTPAPRLDFDPSLGNGPSQCLADRPDADKMVNVTRSAWLRGIPESKNGSIGLQVKAYWEKRGYVIQVVKGFANGQPDISGVTKDDYLISIGTADNGWLSIGVTSPCIYPHGTP